MGNGDAFLRGRTKAKEEYPAKYHQLAFRVKQKELARSPAIHMAHEIKHKIRSTQKSIERYTARKEKFGNQTVALQAVITKLDGKAARAHEQTKTIKATLAKRTRSYENKYSAEVLDIKTSTKQLRRKLDISKKKRETGLQKMKNALMSKISTTKNAIALLEPRVRGYATRAEDAQRELTDLEKEKATKEGSLQ